MRKITALLVLAVAAVTAGCGSSSKTSSATSATSAGASTTASAVNPNQHETLPPGDIPDTIAYPAYPVPGAGITVSAPEGWSRSNAPGAVTFKDKLNEIRLFTVPATGPLTPAAAQSSEVPKIAASLKGFKLQSVTTVSRPAGPAVRITYLGDSTPDSVTGKVGTLAFERYDFFHGGKEVVLVLSSPNGSDNVDPWRKVTSSLKFTR